MTPGAVLLIGAGRMGSALLRGWISLDPSQQSIVVEPNPSETVRDCARNGSIDLYSDLEPQRLPRIRATVLDLKPQVIKAETALLPTLARIDSLMISISAGITAPFISSNLAARARVVRAMPHTP